MDIYYAYTIASTDDVILALLSQYSFESFEEKDDHIVGYISLVNNRIEHQSIEKLLSDRNITFQVNEIAPRNWNEEWEKSFQPVEIDDFLRIRADFHPMKEGYEHDIVINPKMAFGTGHHETTYMMSIAMGNLDFVGKRVFDYGCGTAILSILASKLGAEFIDAIDIETPAYESAIENAQLNGIKNINASRTTLEQFNGHNYDIILANINRTVLLNSAKELYHRLNDDGALLLSGILEEDERLVNSTYKSDGFTLENRLQRGKWLCLKYVK